MRLIYYKDLLQYYVYISLKSDFSRGGLGFLWWFLEPILYLGAIYVAFSGGLRGGGTDFAFFLLCGLIPWKWFASSLQQGSRSLFQNSNVIGHVNISKALFPAIPVFANGFKFIIILSMLIFIVPPLDYSSLIYLPVIVLVQLILNLSVASFIAAIAPFFRDILIVIDNLLLFLFFMSGIVFQIDKIPENIKKYIYLNPLVSLIEAYRGIILSHAQLNWSSMSYIFIFSTALYVLSLYLFDLNNYKYAKVLQV